MCRYVFDFSEYKFSPSTVASETPPKEVYFQFTPDILPHLARSSNTDSEILIGMAATGDTTDPKNGYDKLLGHISCERNQKDIDDFVGYVRLSGITNIQ
jgi:hypothetical protein